MLTLLRRVVFGFVSGAVVALVGIGVAVLFSGWDDDILDDEDDE